jgi:hypothetical protein
MKYAVSGMMAAGAHTEPDVSELLARTIAAQVFHLEAAIPARSAGYRAWRA